MKRWMGLLVCLFLVVAATALPSSAEDAPGMVVGRIFYTEGDLLRYVPAEEDWVAVVKDAPFGSEDTLFSGSHGMAELIVPNGAWIRIGNSTQLQFIALDRDLAEVDVASGVARFYNKGSDTAIKVTSPFGYVLAYPGSIFDFYVGDNSLEVVAVRGKVSFVHSATEAKYDVVAGSPSILADPQQVSSGEGTIDPVWDRWNRVRENFWAAKARVRGRSVEYLPPTLRDESYALDENGRWEKVYYGGAERWFWRPTTVALGWSPFTVGRWTDWYGDQTWIPAEPFGYITHHYGNWVYVGNYWYWAPPVARVRVGMPFLDVGFFWYPGRVFWIHTGPYVGWVPLAPRETYYCYRPWGGPRVVVVNNINITQINVNVRNYVYVNHAIVVNQNNFYNVNNYRNVRVTNINRTTIINNYHAAPVVNNTVINNYSTIKQRHNYTNATVKEKPHNTVINRIQHNETIIHEGRKEKAGVLRERVKSTPEGRVGREARIEQPKIPNYIVPANEVNRPKSEIKFQQKEIKKSLAPTKPVPPRPPKPEVVAPTKPVPPRPPKPEVVTPTKPVPPRPPKPEVVTPTKPVLPRPTKPEVVTPIKPVAPPPPKPEVKAPTKPVPPAPPKPEVVTPIKPVAPPPPKPEVKAPAKPVPPPPPKPEVKAPTKPVPPPPPKPEVVTPIKPVAPSPPKPEVKAPTKPVPPPPPKPEAEAPAKPPSQEKPQEKAGQRENP